MMTALDTERVSRAVGSAHSGPGGAALVITVLSAVPGVVHTAARRGLFRSSSEHLQIGDWRYEVAPDGRLRAAHVVEGVVIAEETLPNDSVGSHLTRALEQLVLRYGTTILPNIDGAVEVLETSAGSF
jgi:hypothetical protein